MRRLSAVCARAREASRRHALASDRRAGAYARDLARRRQYKFARHQWRLLVLVVTAFTLLPAPFLWFLPGAELRAFAAGGLVTSGFWCAWWTVVQLTGTASTMVGALGEQWSASELRKLSRQGWRILNHVVLRHHDIDHVAVGPGGVVVVESKWTAEPWAWNGPYLQRTIKRVRSDAMSVQGMIQSRVGRGKVSGAIVIWGAGLEETDGTLPCDVGGVMVADAESLVSLLDLFSTAHRLTPDEVEIVWEILVQQVERRDAADAARVPPVLGAGDVVALLGTGFVGLITGLVLPALAFRLPGTTATSTVVASLLALLGWKARRIPLLRWFPQGLLLGGQFWVVLVVATYLLLLTPLL